MSAERFWIVFVSASTIHLGFLMSQRAKDGSWSRRPADGLHIKLGEVINELVANGVTLEQARCEFERQYVVAALHSSGGGIGRSAELLGVHRNTLRNKVCALGIRPVDYAPRRRA